MRALFPSPRLRVPLSCAGSAVLNAGLVAALALCAASAATARPSETGWRNQDAVAEYQASPRRHARRHGYSRRSHWHRHRAPRRTLARTRLDGARAANVAAAGATKRTPAPEPVPVEQRSFVAAHPLMPDPQLNAPAPFLASGEAIGPRCRSTHRSAFALAVASFGSDFETAQPAFIEGAWP